MAVDVVGYSRLMGEDEAGTARAVREHRDAARPLVATRGGHIVKTMGDGLLLEFPSVVAAVECAIAIQRLMVERNTGTPQAKRILYRIGVNLGDVLVEGDDILGEGVNIAARLEGICEPGGVLISGSAFEHVRGKIDVNFFDLGEKGLKNIARPVRVFSFRNKSDVPATAAPAPEKHGPSRRSIVVLPFANLGGDTEQDYFADGVTESLTTDLSRIGGLFVIARNTAFTYKGKAQDVRQIGRDLNVRYVLEGSIQRGGARMRINVQLIDAHDGNHVWAERFEKPVVDLFDMQDEIVARLANSLNAQLAAAEARRAEHTPKPDSMDLYFQGKAWFNKGRTPEILARARMFFERAVALDPQNVDALVGMASTDVIILGNFYPDDRIVRFNSAEATLVSALCLAPDHALGHTYLGVLKMYTKRASEGIADCERALALDRNLAVAHGYIGMAKYFSGRAGETEAHIREALRLSPRDTFAHVWMMMAGIAKIFAGFDEEAIGLLRQALEAKRGSSVTHIYLAAALARVGRLDEARIAANVGMSMDPSFTIQRYQAGAPTENPIFISGRDRVYEGMRRAGIPEA